jgi:hypothetical protein
MTVTEKQTVRLCGPSQVLPWLRAKGYKWAKAYRWFEPEDCHHYFVIFLPRKMSRWDAGMLRLELETETHFAAHYRIYTGWWKWLFRKWMGEPDA